MPSPHVQILCLRDSILGEIFQHFSICKKLTCARTPPGISVLDYLHRLAKHATLTPPLLLSMVYYLDRLCALYPDFTVTSLTIHRFLIAAATVAAKGLSDSFWNNSTYARVGGIKIAELGLLELDFLYRVDWKIVPNPEVLVDYYKGLIERTEGFEMASEVSVSEEDDVDDVEDEDDDITDSLNGIARNEARTSCDGLLDGQRFDRIAGKAEDDCREERKEGPPNGKC